MTKILLTGTAVALALAAATVAMAQAPAAPPPPPVVDTPPMPPMPPMAVLHGPKTRAEVLTRAHTQFSALDKNKDGFISRDELPAFPRHGRMEMRRMMAPPGAPIPPHPPKPPMAGEGGPDAMFAMLDANKDGQISKAEFDAFHAGPSRHVEMVTDKDGRTVHTERVIVMRGRPDAMRPEPGMSPMPPMARMGRLQGMTLAARFDAIDADNDGKLSAKEIDTAALARFDRIDINRDGALSPAEIKAGAPRMAMRIEMRRGPSAPMARGGPVRGPGYDLPAGPMPPTMPVTK